MEKLEPKIRFSGFGGSWKNNILGNIATFSKGKGYSKKDLENDGVPIILYGRLYTNYQTVIKTIDTYSKLRKNSILSEGGEIIIPSSGETPEDISIASTIKYPNVIIAGDLNIIKTDKLDSTFLALSLSNGKVKKELTNYAEGATITHLKNKDIKKVKLDFPNLNEQEKIGSLFEKFDSLIEKQEKSIDLNKRLKDSLLQKAFPKINHSEPYYRLSGFKNKWKNRKISDFSIKNTLKNKDNLINNVESVSNKKGFISQEEQFDNRVASKDLSNYYIIKPYMFAYNPSRINVGSIAFKSDNSFSVVSPLYVSFSLNNNLSNKFFYYWLKTSSFARSMQNNSEGSVRKTLNYESFANINIIVPKYEEQEKIGSLFKSLDEKIEKEEKKLTLYKSLKKSLLQKMFI